MRGARRSPSFRAPASTPAGRCRPAGPDRSRCGADDNWLLHGLDDAPHGRDPEWLTAGISRRVPSNLWTYMAVACESKLPRAERLGRAGRPSDAITMAIGQPLGCDGAPPMSMNNA